MQGLAHLRDAVAHRPNTTTPLRREPGPIRVRVWGLRCREWGFGNPKPLNPKPLKFSGLVWFRAWCLEFTGLRVWGRKVKGSGCAGFAGEQNGSNYCSDPPTTL